MKSEPRSLKAAAKANKETKLSRTQAPADLSPVDWQCRLRRQFGREQAFGLENIGDIEESMLSVLAFKRSLSAGILDGGNSEISLGGSRLTRFMREVENVTGGIGEGEAVTPAEEVGSAAADEAAAVGDTGGDGNGAVAPRETSADPWQALVQIGAQFIAALASGNDAKAPAHPWIERDPATGVRNPRFRCRHRKSRARSRTRFPHWPTACWAGSRDGVACGWRGRLTG